MTGQDPLTDLNSLRWARPEQLVETPTSARVKARKSPKGSYVAGKMPLDWLVRVDQAYPRALLVTLVIKYKIDVARGREPVTVGESDVSLPSHTLNRTLHALERAGIVRLERHPGRLARIWLIDKP
jgi:hypothetical protein